MHPARAADTRHEPEQERGPLLDVIVPDIPASYNEYRASFRAFIAEHRPVLHWKPGVGVRTPELERDVAALQTWVHQLCDAGYVVARHLPTTLDSFQKRIVHEELAAAGVPFSVGNALVSGAIATFGTQDQKDAHLQQIASGEQIWTQLFSEPDAGSDLTSLKTRGVLDGDVYVVTGQDRKSGA